MKNNNIENYNYNIALMRILFGFLVICIHYLDMDKYNEYLLFRTMHHLMKVAVPVFFLISFYLAEKTFENPDFDKLKKRIKRLYIPFISWGILYFITYKTVDFILKKKGFSQDLNNNISIKSLFWQLIFGHCKELCPPLWYLIDSIIVLFLFWIIYKYLNRYSWHIILLIIVFSFGVQYLGINYKIFGRMPYEVCYPLGRLSEVIPVACVGVLFAKYKITDYIKKSRIFSCFISLISLIVITYGGGFTVPDKQFGYAGTHILIYASVIFLFFFTIPFDNSPIYLKKAIKFLSDYSLGVYCIHLGIGYYWDNVVCNIYSIEKNTITECIIIYTISLMISLGISKLPLKCVRYIVN